MVNCCRTLSDSSETLLISGISKFILSLRLFDNLFIIYVFTLSNYAISHLYGQCRNISINLPLQYLSCNKHCLIILYIQKPLKYGTFHGAFYLLVFPNPRRTIAISATQNCATCMHGVTQGSALGHRPR